jgi:hypothetical protein
VRLMAAASAKTPMVAKRWASANNANPEIFHRIIRAPLGR